MATVLSFDPTLSCQPTAHISRWQEKSPRAIKDRRIKAVAVAALVVLGAAFVGAGIYFALNVSVVGAPVVIPAFPLRGRYDFLTMIVNRMNSSAAKPDYFIKTVYGVISAVFGLLGLSTLTGAIKSARLSDWKKYEKEDEAKVLCAKVKAMSLREISDNASTLERYGFITADSVKKIKQIQEEGFVLRASLRAFKEVEGEENASLLEQRVPLLEKKWEEYKQSIVQELPFA